MNKKSKIVWFVFPFVQRAETRNFTLFLDSFHRHLIDICIENGDNKTGRKTRAKTGGWHVRIYHDQQAGVKNPGI